MLVRSLLANLYYIDSFMVLCVIVNGIPRPWYRGIEGVSRRYLRMVSEAGIDPANVSGEARHLIILS